MAILVSGGAGYIGSHTCIELLNAGYDVVVADNYYNASPVVLDRIKQITGKDFRFYKADMTKHEDVEHIFSECPDITAVIQFAAYKAVGESVSKPIEYYYNNLNCTLVILDVMRHHNCHNFVFSSSATVYGDPASVPITEDFPTGATTNPYGTTKVFTERILQDVCKADPSLNVALLRYFNPIGAHKSGLIGEDPNGIPNNLMPYIAKVAVGKLEKVHVFGNDYPPPDLPISSNRPDFLITARLLSMDAMKLLYASSDVAFMDFRTGTNSSAFVPKSSYFLATSSKDFCSASSALFWIGSMIFSIIEVKFFVTPSIALFIALFTAS